MQEKLADQIWKRGYIQMDQIKIGGIYCPKKKRAGTDAASVCGAGRGVQQDRFQMGNRNTAA